MQDTFDIGLRALNESSHFVTQPVRTAYWTNQEGGLAMMQSDPYDETGPPIFMHANIAKWSVKDIFAWNSMLRQAISDGVRAVSSPTLIAMGIDPEPNLWKVAQTTACWSPAFGSRQACLRLREYRSRAFNVTSPPQREARWFCGIGWL